MIESFRTAEIISTCTEENEPYIESDVFVILISLKCCQDTCSSGRVIGDAVISEFGFCLLRLVLIVVIFVIVIFVVILIVILFFIFFVRSVFGIKICVIMSTDDGNSVFKCE